MKKICISLFLCLVVPLAAPAQARSISGDEFNSIYYSLLEKARELPRTVRSRLKHLDDGTVSSTETWVYKFLPPSRRYLLYDKTEGRSTVQLGEIDLDGSLYCLKNGRAWTPSAQLCIPGLLRSRSQSAYQVLGKLNSEFSESDVIVESSTGKLYREYIRYRNSSSDPDQLRFAENKFWVNDKGLIVRQEITTGKIGARHLGSTWIDEYDYKTPVINIDQPLK
jgi:hypothetical protein